MKIHFTELKSSDAERRAAAVQQIKTHQATILTRIDSHEECVAIIPSSDSEENRYYWVWLTSKADGAYCNGVAKSIESIAHTIVCGQWQFKPEATIVVESNNPKPE